MSRESIAARNTQRSSWSQKCHQTTWQTQEWQLTPTSELDSLRTTQARKKTSHHRSSSMWSLLNRNNSEKISSSSKNSVKQAMHGLCKSSSHHFQIIITRLVGGCRDITSQAQTKGMFHSEQPRRTCNKGPLKVLTR